MEYKVSQIDKAYDFTVYGTSFIGNPRDNTILFVTAKVERMLEKLEDCKECLVFAEKGLEIPESLKASNCFIMVDDPQLEYAYLAVEIAKEEKRKNQERKYTLTEGGYYLGENVTLGSNCFIEPGCRIGHDVVIGDNAYIRFGSTICNAVIGNDFACSEYSCIGIDSFYMSEGEKSFRIPSFGKVIIKDNVDVSCNVIIERGFISDTIIGNNNKFDSAVIIGHDSCLGDNVVVTSETSVAGLVNIGDDAYIGMNSTVKQFVNIGANAVIGMGTNVVADVPEGVTVIGNPAREMKRK